MHNVIVEGYVVCTHLCEDIPFLNAESCLWGSKPESQTPIMCTLSNKPPQLKGNVKMIGISVAMGSTKAVNEAIKNVKEAFFANYGRLPGKIEPFSGKTMLMLSLFGSKNWILSDSHLGMHGSPQRGFQSYPNFTSPTIATRVDLKWSSVAARFLTQKSCLL